MAVAKVKKEFIIMLLKNPRILIWILFIVLSLVVIAPNPDPHGLKIVFVEKNSTSGLAAGEILYSINDMPATLENINLPYFDLVKLETSKGSKYARINGTLGISAEPVQSTNLNLGLDLRGGVRAVVASNTTDQETIDQIISTLNTRINLFGLREATLRPVTSGEQKFIEITMAGGSIAELKDLLETQGVFESKIPFTLGITDSKSTVKLDKDYVMQLSNKSLIVEGNVYMPGDVFELEGIKFTYEGTGARLNLTALVFTGSDIKTVYYDPQRSRVSLEGQTYRWFFSIQLSTEGAQRFAKVTKNLGSQPGGYLDSPIVLYLDNEIIDSLSIASSLKGKVETEIQISGGSDSMDAAIAEKSRLQSILRSGALPVEISIIQLDSVSPNLGSGFMYSAVLAGFIALIGVTIIVFLRYRHPKLVLPMMIVTISEVIITTGVATVIGWTIDLAAIGGIIAAVGTGINDQIIILDQTLRGEIENLSLKERLKRAFFIIFGAAGTLIVAMLPLTFVGFGALRGFAIVTIIGVLTGIIITRPAYGKIVESLTKKN
ncbi:MAG TPA: hypothetical protein VI968_00775 [archaeon]|nr:hypothetical protein [archaeon]